MISYLTSHAVAVVTSIASLLMAARLLDSRRSSQSTLAWVLAIVFMPFVAIPLYLMLGARKFPRAAKGVSDGPTPGVGTPRPGHTFELLATGGIAYPRLLELIRSAERSIDLTMFILGRDETGDAVVQALAERAAHKIRVRVILDAVGCSRTHGRAAAVIGAEGGEVRVFMPLTHSPVRGRTNLRSHRKLAVFDRVRVFAGGMNLASEYMGPPMPAPGRPPRWRDVAAVVSGPAAADAEALFESDWVFCGGHRKAESMPVLPEPPLGGETVQLVASGPDMATDTLYDLFLTVIFGAQERIAIVTPYYVPDDLLQHALILAARRGVRTELLVPSRSNHRVADMARRSLLRELTAEGVTIHYYPAGMVHAKAMVVDHSFAYVGSPNFDMRSLFLNYENALCVYSPGAIGQIRAFVDGLIAQSVRTGPAGRPNWIIEQVARLMAPEL